MECVDTGALKEHLSEAKKYLESALKSAHGNDIVVKQVNHALGEIATCKLVISEGEKVKED